MATCSAMSRIRSATDPDSIVVAQPLVCVVDLRNSGSQTEICMPFAQKKKWAKTHRTTHPRSEQALDYTDSILPKQVRVRLDRMRRICSGDSLSLWERVGVRVYGRELTFLVFPFFPANARTMGESLIQFQALH